MGQHRLFDICVDSWIYHKDIDAIPRWFVIWYAQQRYSEFGNTSFVKTCWISDMLSTKRILREREYL